MTRRARIGCCLRLLHVWIPAMCSLFASARGPSSKGGLFSLVGAFHWDGTLLVEAGSYEANEESFPRYMLNIKLKLSSGVSSDFALGVMSMPEGHVGIEKRFTTVYMAYTKNWSWLTVSLNGAILSDGDIGGYGITLAMIFTPVPDVSVIGEGSFVLGVNVYNFSPCIVSVFLVAAVNKKSPCITPSIPN